MAAAMNFAREPASFRDPAGFVFVLDGEIYRQVSHAGASDYDLLMSSGLYEALTRDGLLVHHEEVPALLTACDGAHRVLRPNRVPFVSYPYEWCFGQLKAAALATLRAQTVALSHGLTLRDANAYNVQFLRGSPCLVDTLSFGRYREGTPWVGYRQFCQHFLAPLALMSAVDPSLGKLLRAAIDGIALPLASRLLPSSSCLRPGVLAHVHLHARSIRRAETTSPRLPRGRKSSRRFMSLKAIRGLIDTLEATVDGLSYSPTGSVWADYYECTNYTSAASAGKAEVVEQLISRASRRAPLGSVWDLGANTGRFSRLAAQAGALVVAMDSDHAAVERHYRDCTARAEPNVLPLLQDLTDPSPAIGWNHAERRSLSERGPADLVMALAFVHHLAIGHNIPLPAIVAFLRRLAPAAIIEFVPKQDSQAQRLLASREDVFPDYSLEDFERAAASQFHIADRVPVPESQRTLLLLEPR